VNLRNQGDCLWYRLFGQKLNGKLRDNLPFAFGKGGRIDSFDIFTIMICRYSDVHDLFAE
jgi:hypothetical protein